MKIIVDLFVVIYSVNKKSIIGFCMDIQRYFCLFSEFLLRNKRGYSCCIVATMYILIEVTGQYSYAASPFDVDIGRGFARMFKPNYFNSQTFQDNCSGKMNSASAGTFRYPYIAFNNNIPAVAIPALEQHFISMGYNPIGQNATFKVDGKLIASCDINVNRLSQYSNSNMDFYECTAQCNLKDYENNFSVYGGQSTAYGSDRRNLQAKAVFLAFRNLGRNSQPPQTYPVSIDGFDNGVRTNRQTDYAEAVLDAKKQAIERAGVRMDIGRKTGRTYRHRNGQDSLDKYSINNIESYASGVLVPGCRIEDHGYGRDGSYKVTLRGEVFQDPVTAIKNHTDNVDMQSIHRGHFSSQPSYGQYAPAPRERNLAPGSRSGNGISRTNTTPRRSMMLDELLQNPGIQDALERNAANSITTVMGLQGDITIQLIRSFRNSSGKNCKSARATFSSTSMVRNFTACRDPYTATWNLNHKF
ncbi:MAG: hypothetical protein D3919_09180 [Candidatus Electrothrix sp. AW5]|nr:hypothetical protein [Candidatus Electrothrix gigas]